MLSKEPQLENIFSLKTRGTHLYVRSPLGAGECEVTLSGLVGVDGDGWADSRHSAGAPCHIAKAHTGNVAEVKEHRRVALIEYLESAQNDQPRL